MWAVIQRWFSDCYKCCSCGCRVEPEAKDGEATFCNRVYYHGDFLQCRCPERPSLFCCCECLCPPQRDKLSGTAIRANRRLMYSVACPLCCPFRLLYFGILKCRMFNNNQCCCGDCTTWGAPPFVVAKIVDPNGREMLATQPAPAPQQQTMPANGGSRYDRHYGRDGVPAVELVPDANLSGVASSQRTPQVPFGRQNPMNPSTLARYDDGIRVTGRS